MSEIRVRPLRENDLAEADRIFRTAFGTFIGLRDPAAFAGDTDYVRTRWRLEPAAAFVAEENGEVIGSNFVTNWGSLGFFGPLSVRVDRWNGGIARRLLAPTMECFARWGTRHAGLFTFAQSTKHVHLYQQHGFAPRFLTAIMSKPVDRAAATADWTTFSATAAADRAATLDDVRELTDAVYDGLDVSREITGADEHGLGDTVLLARDGRLAGIAVCHVGAGTEAGSSTCYVKFAAARPGASAGAAFDDLLTACEAFAALRGAERLSAGVNSARRGAYGRMIVRGFRTDILGIAMQRPDEPATNHPDAWVIDDWR